MAWSLQPPPAKTSCPISAAYITEMPARPEGPEKRLCASPLPKQAAYVCSSFLHTGKYSALRAINQAYSLHTYIGFSNLALCATRNLQICEINIWGQQTPISQTSVFLHMSGFCLWAKHCIMYCNLARITGHKWSIWDCPDHVWLLVKLLKIVLPRLTVLMTQTFVMR